MSATDARAGQGSRPPFSPPSSRPFSTFERMVAWRYLRSRRKEAFISVIAGFSFIGIMLGVATLIIVMAVMNGFRTELISRILGINGHMIVQPLDGPLDNYADLATKFSGVTGVTMAIPLVEGQTLASGPGGGRHRRSGARRAGRRSHQDEDRFPTISSPAIWSALPPERRCRSARAWPSSSDYRRRDHHADVAGGRRHADGRQPARQVLQGLGDLRDRHVGI